MKKAEEDWIIASDGSNPEYPFGFCCLRCGQKQEIPRPIPVEVYIFWGKYFGRIHRRCTAAIAAVKEGQE